MTVCSEAVQTFSYSQLSDKAKQRARQTRVEQPWFLADEWWDASYEDFMNVSPILGITIDTKSGRESRPNMSFSGFSSQGDGACFVGSYRVAPDSVAKIRVRPGRHDLHDRRRAGCAASRLHVRVRRNLRSIAVSEIQPLWIDATTDATTCAPTQRLDARR